MLIKFLQYNLVLEAHMSTHLWWLSDPSTAALCRRPEVRDLTREPTFPLLLFFVCLPVPRRTAFTAVSNTVFRFSPVIAEHST